MSTTTTMKAVNYQGPFKVKVEDVERPKLEHPDDIIVKVTTVCRLYIALSSIIVYKLTHAGCHLWLRSPVR